MEQLDIFANDNGPIELDLSWEATFAFDTRARGVHAESAADALVLSLNALGRVDIDYIATAASMSRDEAISQLQGSIYQNPATWNGNPYGGWETADEYLTGHIASKLERAKAADREHPYRFERNIRALEHVLPASVGPESIYVTLGSPWVPTHIIDEFILSLLGPIRWYSRGIYYRTASALEIPVQARVKHDAFTGSWDIPMKNRYGDAVSARQTFGTRRMNALEILERTLNHRAIVVKDRFTVPKGAKGSAQAVNQAETALALEKQQRIIEEFQNWVWLDGARSDQLQRIFERRYGCVRTRTFDGSFLTFPTMSPAAHLYPYQKDAVARMLFSPNTLLAHDVGSGKTYEMVAAGMELKRMGLSSKNLYVVPGNILGQWRGVFAELYPQADVLFVAPKDFTPSKREAVLEDIRDTDYDAVVMPYSCFTSIPISLATRLEASGAELAELIARGKVSKEATTRLKRKIAAAEKARARLLEQQGAAEGVCFEELGVTRLFVDEAHNFKNVPIDTQMKNVLGISAKGSARAKDMMDKVRLVQKANAGAGVVLATGTPITNSITEAYVLQQYLQPGVLSMLGLQSFDSWVGMFAEQRTGFEIDVDTSTYRMATRFAKFHNLPELTQLLAQVADFHQVDASAGIPELDGYTDELVEKTPEFEAYLRGISKRADAVRQRKVPRAVDNMLKITTDGRKAALDMRLVDPQAWTARSKVALCARNVFRIYARTMAERGAQLVFCDTSTPKAGFNLYDELKCLLVEMGVGEDEVAFVHSAKNERQRSRLFARVNSGEVRVLVGSTFKLGLGVNVQERLCALHHLDVPWRPADMTQREGRMLRQGNMWPRVEIYRYITKGSFDAYSWQLLETKQHFITALLAGSMDSRSESDVDDTVLNYAEVKALAVGNPLIKKRVEVANDLMRYQTLQRKALDARELLARELSGLPGEIERLAGIVAQCRRDCAFVESKPAEDPDALDAKARRAREEMRRSLRQLIFARVVDNNYKRSERTVATYRGFKIVLPANMAPHDRFVWLCRSGRYRVALGDKEAGVLQRIDNRLADLPRRREELEQRLQETQERERDIRRELAVGESYAEQIEARKAELRSIDMQLGVDMS